MEKTDLKPIPNFPVCILFFFLDFPTLQIDCISVIENPISLDNIHIPLSIN